MQTIPFHQNNIEYNPLYAKMQERFCHGGTIAEKMEKKAIEYRKENPAQTYGEYHMTHANSLPDRAERKQKKAFSLKRSLFSLRHISTACMVLLVGGTLLFSGATMGSLFASDKDASELALPATAAQTLMLDESVTGEDETHLLSEAPDVK